MECISRVEIHIQTYIHMRYEGYLRKNYHKKPQPVSYGNRCEERNLSLLSLCEVHFCLNTWQLFFKGWWKAVVLIMHEDQMTHLNLGDFICDVLHKFLLSVWLESFLLLNWELEQIKNLNSHSLPRSTISVMSLLCAFWPCYF